MANSLNIQNLIKYIDQINPDIQREIIQGADFLQSGVSIHDGVKYKKSVNRMFGDFIVSSDVAGKGFGEGGDNLSTVKLDTAELEVVALKSELQFYEKDVNDIWLQTLAKKGSYNEDMPSNFNQAYMAMLSDKTQLWIENQLIRGVQGATYSSFNKHDGLIQIIEDSNDIVEVPTLSTGLGVDNVMDAFDRVMDYLPENILTETDLTVYCSVNVFKMLVRAMREANYFHYEQSENLVWEMTYPQNNVKIKGLAGMSGLNNKLIATHAKNIHVGFDDLNDASNFSVWYNQDADAIRNRLKWKQGITILEPKEVVYYNKI